jgi:hypothetical protein
MEDRSAPPAPGWIVQLTGNEFDFSHWECSLTPQLDPWCERTPRDGSFIWALRSPSFDHLQSADEVRKRAIPLIQWLNGALGAEVGAELLTLHGVGRIDDQGEFHINVFTEASLRAGEW